MNEVHREPSQKAYSPDSPLANGQQSAITPKSMVESAEDVTNIGALDEVKPPSPTFVRSDPDSEDEIIVFGGRKRPQNISVSHPKVYEEDGRSSGLPGASTSNRPNVIGEIISNGLSNLAGKESRNTARPKSSYSYSQDNIDQCKPLQWPRSSIQHEAVVAEYAENARSQELLSDYSIQVPFQRYKTNYS